MSTAATLTKPAPPPVAVPRHAPPTPLDGRRLALGTAAVAVALLPLLRPGGPGNIAPVDLPIMAAVGACALWGARSGHRFRFPYGLAMTVFMAGGVLGALAGPVPSAGILAVVQDVMLLVWCWTVANLASSPERLRVLMRTWAYAAVCWASILFVGVMGHIALITGATAREGSRTSLTLIDPNYSASYYFISIMLIWATGYPRRRSVRIVAYVLLIAAIASTGSNSGTVSLVVGSAVAATMAVYHRRGVAAAVSVGVVFALAGFAFASTVKLSAIQQAAHGSNISFLRDGIGRGNVSVGQRQMLVKESIRLYEAGGPLGQGPTSTKVRLKRELAPFVKEAHDDYLAALIERGLVGLCGLALLLSTIGRSLVSVAPGRLAAGYRAVVVRPHALVGAVAGTLVASAVYELLHVRHIWTLFAFLAALHLWGRRTR